MTVVELPLPRFFADYRRAAGGGWLFEVKDRRAGCRVVFEGWTGGGKRDAKIEVRRWLTEQDVPA